MTSPLLTTKLYIPRVRPREGVVSRPRLIARLNEGLHRKLTLVSAPAGFGKTTLVCEWLDDLRLDTTKENQSKNRVAWLSVDENDNDPARFLTYFITGLRRVEGVENTVGEGALNMLQAPQPPSIINVLTLLINEITGITDRVIFVIDDYHTIESSQVHSALMFLLDNLPSQLHLVIATRTDPEFPRARLRARGQLTELRGADLRFTSAETAEFLNQVMSLDLSAEDIAALETRTEGWIAGLQLAALALQGKEDTTKLIRSFSGSHRLVLDYLIEEVLDQQPASVQTFLFQTSILKRFTGSLCDAVRFGSDKSPTRHDSGQAILEMLEHANLFIVPLDEERCWYRYHHLFSDLLLRRLNQTQSEHLPILHQRASEWYEQNGFTDEAIEHALRAQNYEYAVCLIEEHVDEMWSQSKHTNLRRWLAELPVESVLSKPRLCIFRAWYLFASGQQDEAERFLQATELAHDPDIDRATEIEPQEQVQVPGSNRLTLRGRAAAIRAFMAGFIGDVPAVIHHARQALAYLSEQELMWRSTAAVALGDGYGLKGDMISAYQARLKASQLCKAAGNIYFLLVANSKLAITMREQGRLKETIKLCEQQMQLAKENGLSQTGTVGGIMAIWGEVLAELNDLEGAKHLARKGAGMTEPGGPLAALGWSHLCLMRILFSCGDLDGMKELIQKMEKIDRESSIPPWIAKQMATWQVRLWLTQDDLEVASRWAEEGGLHIGGKPGPLPEIDFFTLLEYVALARVLIAQQRLDDATRLLQWLLETAQIGGRTSRAIEIRLLQALTFEAGGDTAQAMISLERALRLAEPRGFYRIFVDEGPSMAPLLYKALDRGIAPDHLRRLLQAFPIHEPKQLDQSEPPGLEAGYIEPLSEREIQVLQLIAAGLTNPEIATRLVLSVHTVKTHAKNIYSKLDVHTRTEAVARARTCGILPST